MVKKLKDLSKAPTTVAYIIAGVTTVIGFVVGVQPETAEAILKFFSESAQNQIAQAGFFFMAASWIHSGRVKKEIRANFEALTMAIDKVADAFRADIRIHAARIDSLSDRVEDLESKQQEA